MNWNSGLLWFFRRTPTAPPKRRKTVLIMGADGKKHRADAETHVIVGKTAMKRHLRGLKKSQNQPEIMSGPKS